MMRLDPYRTAPEPPAEFAEAVFVAGVGFESVLGYSVPLEAGELVSSSLEDPILDSIFHPQSGGTLTLWLIGLSSTPPGDIYSAIQIYSGDDFQEGNLIVELEFGSSTDIGDNVRQWTWSSGTAGNPFAGGSGQTFGVRFIP